MWVNGKGSLPIRGNQKANCYIKTKVCCLFKMDNSIHKYIYVYVYRLLDWWLGADISDLQATFPKYNNKSAIPAVKGRIDKQDENHS